MTGERLLLGFPVVHCGGEYSHDEGVGADALGGGLAVHRFLEIDGQLQQLLRRLGHLRECISWDILGSTEKQGSRRANVQPFYSRRYIR